MGAHLIDGQFQSDKYPSTPRGFVPLKVSDPKAQPYLWAYAQDHRAVDAEFSEDLEVALLIAGYSPGGVGLERESMLYEAEVRGDTHADTDRRLTAGRELVRAGRLILNGETGERTASGQRVEWYRRIVK